MNDTIISHQGGIKMVGSTQIFNYEKTKDMHMYYPLDKLYYGYVEGYESIICEIDINHKPKYVELITLPNFVFIDRVLNNNFEITKSLKEEINNKNLDVCLLTKDGELKKEINISEVENFVKLINLLENKPFNDLNETCTNVVNKISDLLGINVYSNPSSNLKLKNITEVVIPATKVIKFKNLLFKYIKISIILDDLITISNNDYRIIRALKCSKIKMPITNEFLITANLEKQINIECSNVVDTYQKKLKSVPNYRNNI
jgi:hypothetical protein